MVAGQRKTDPTTILINILLVVVYGAILFSGLKSFSLWQQILDLRTMNPLTVLTELHPHSLRLIVMLPFLFLADQLGVPMDTPFTIALFCFFVLNGWMVARLLALIGLKDIRRAPELFVFGFLPIAILSLAMNGRIAMAMFGILAIVYLQVLHVARVPGLVWLRTIGQVVGLLLASVSSGTLMVAFLALVLGGIWMGLARWPKVERRDLVPVIAGLMGGLLVLPLVIVGLMKNINFYGGGIDGFVNMLQHGGGKVLPSEPILAGLAAVGFIGFGLAVAQIVFARLARKGSDGPVYLAVMLGTAGGAFGFSTIASVIPIFMVAGYLWVWKGMVESAISARGTVLEVV